MPRIYTPFCFLLLLLLHTTVHGALRFANYYQDHMVLQRAPQRAVVWGYIDGVNRPIILTLDNKVYQTISSSVLSDAANESIWSVTLDAQTQEGPFKIQVTQPEANGTKETIVLNDVLFGDVWICSGQSNMEFAVINMFNASVEIENANKYPKIRLFTLGHHGAYTPLEEPLEIDMRWSYASNVTVGDRHTSAICWLYGRMVQEALGGRPIGLVHTSWGGTVIEYWSPPDVLNACNINVTDVEKATDSDLAVDAILNNTVLYNNMIHPFTRMVIKGVLWYQGENNVNYNRDKYNCTFPKMIEAWRNVWHMRTNGSTDAAFPFGFVQLSTSSNDSNYIGGLPWIRWHQTFDIGYVPNKKVPNVFMAVTLDLRDDEHGVHPRDKLDVGYRLSRSGLAVAYGFKNITYLGPIIADITVAPDSSKVTISYANEASSSIELRNPHGFEVCCAGEVCQSNETIWVASPASRVEGTQLSVSLAVPSSCASKPIGGVRYLWRTTPCLFKQAAVYNSDDSDLPAPPYIHYF